MVCLDVDSFFQLLNFYIYRATDRRHRAYSPHTSYFRAKEIHIGEDTEESHCWGSCQKSYACQSTVTTSSSVTVTTTCSITTSCSIITSCSITASCSITIITQSARVFALIPRHGARGAVIGKMGGLSGNSRGSRGGKCRSPRLRLLLEFSLYFNELHGGQTYS